MGSNSGTTCTKLFKLPLIMDEGPKPFREHTNIRAKMDEINKAFFALPFI